MIHLQQVEVNGRVLSFETGALARQADGACVVRYGETVVLATACYRDEPSTSGFLPLTVDYRENTYAGGRIPGGFFRREGRPTEKEILTARVIDRPLRPSFAEGYNHETQVIALVLSADAANDPDILAINAASAALTVSPIPFPNPIGAVRIGLIDGRLAVNPTSAERELSDLDLVVAGTYAAIVMVEAGAREVSEATMLDALDLAHEEIRRIVNAQLALASDAETKKNVPEIPLRYSHQLYRDLGTRFGTALEEAMLEDGRTGVGRDAVSRLRAAITSDPSLEAEGTPQAREAVLDDLEVQTFRRLTTSEGRRLDGRAIDQIRPIEINVGLLPRTHGSAVFTRGQTQALVTVTLGTPREAQKIEDLEGESFQRFLLHYNFPPFSVGEVKFLRGPARREIGHGNLARRAIAPLLPSKEEFPYTIRCVSDILEANGSSSMASVCGASLALMDAGVPLRAAVAGVAMGLVVGAVHPVILTDIAGLEDHEGDMDFKVAGTRSGITALQMDIKTSGISRDLMAEALERARLGRLFILDRMDATIEQPRRQLSAYAPRLYTLQIPADRIRDVIGSGGKTIRWIMSETGAKIDVRDDGTVIVASSDEAAAARTMEIIRGLTARPESGRTYRGTVKRVEDYGAFVEILPGQDGLLHVSEMAHGHVANVRDHAALGDEIEVQVIAIDSDSGKVRLSRRPLLPPPTEEELAAAASERRGRAAVEGK